MQVEEDFIVMVNCRYMLSSHRTFVMAHRGANGFGRENSVRAIRTAVATGATLIEFDIRKSADGVLYCYHGSLIEYLCPWFLRGPFLRISKKRDAAACLTDMAEAAAEDAALFLDIKDHGITARELANAVPPRTRPIFVAAQSITYLHRLGPLPAGWFKIANIGQAFVRPQIARLVAAGIVAVELLPWSATGRLTGRLARFGIRVALARWGLPRSLYLRWSLALNALWVWDSDPVALGLAFRDLPERDRFLDCSTSGLQTSPPPK